MGQTISKKKNIFFLEMTQKSDPKKVTQKSDPKCPSSDPTKKNKIFIYFFVYLTVIVLLCVALLFAIATDMGQTISKKKNFFREKQKKTCSGHWFCGLCCIF
jgi:quinol-cytochrome oxidoreductase complex cytochrome b subunit